MFEPSESAGELGLTIVESGHMLVSQGHDLLDGFSVLDAPSFLKVQQKSDALLFRLTVKGESCLIRLQFSGSRAEALEERGSAVLRLKEYLPVTTQGGPPPLSCPPTPNQPPTKTTAQDQQASAGEAMATEPKVVQGSSSIKRLTQHFLGEHGLSLPLVSLPLVPQCSVPWGAGALPLPVSLGPQLPCLGGGGGRGAEESAPGLRS
ncbi:meiotic recombination protein REC114-like [Oncorhynchus keta]|uniref:meiotic recombination protein REC114-like n=1 Tax=Oncorhynchus keta TaxID=8018 RepID=UPI0015F9D62C|nr:meiotic recombination protein REC114-like [Oncorhynchus keta]XP_035642795.1 meiotic recombination protein REC114-like [Oncorhynchus keta]